MTNFSMQHINSVELVLRNPTNHDVIDSCFISYDSVFWDDPTLLNSGSLAKVLAKEWDNKKFAVGFVVEVYGYDDEEDEESLPQLLDTCILDLSNN